MHLNCHCYLKQFSAEEKNLPPNSIQKLFETVKMRAFETVQLGDEFLLT